MEFIHSHCPFTEVLGYGCMLDNIEAHFMILHEDDWSVRARNEVVLCVDYPPDRCPEF